MQTALASDCVFFLWLFSLDRQQRVGAVFLQTFIRKSCGFDLSSQSREWFENDLR
jgi:hypothetical protein